MEEITCENGNSIELQEILEGLKHKLIVKYFGEPYRVICENGTVTHIEPQYKTMSYIPGAKPREDICQGIGQLVDAFYLNNSQNIEGSEIMELT